MPYTRQYFRHRALSMVNKPMQLSVGKSSEILKESGQKCVLLSGCWIVWSLNSFLFIIAFLSESSHLIMLPNPHTQMLSGPYFKLNLRTQQDKPHQSLLCQINSLPFIFPSVQWYPHSLTQQVLNLSPFCLLLLNVLPRSAYFYFMVS